MGLHSLGAVEIHPVLYVYSVVVTAETYFPDKRDWDMDIW